MNIAAVLYTAIR